MRILKISLLMIFCAFLYIKGYPLYGSYNQNNGCGPSKEYELKEDEVEPMTKNSMETSSSSNSSNSSNKSSSSKK